VRGRRDLVASGVLGPANELLDNALSGTGLPQLQSITVGDPTEDYGDLFIVSLVAGWWASEHAPQLGIARVTGLLSLLLAAMFLLVSSIPATVPRQRILARGASINGRNDLISKAC
jgi:hypothetical protein